MSLILVSLLAGALTVLAPCVAAMLPVVIGASADSDKQRKWRVIASLAVSVFLFSILLKATTLFIGIPQYVWSWISGGIIAAVGLSFLFPKAWLHIAHIIGLETLSQKSSAVGLKKSDSKWQDYILGASLGPVFSACSPTYAVIVAVILPASPAEGLVYLLAFVAGLTAVLAAIAVGGQQLLAKLNFATGADSPFRKIIGGLFVLLGISIALGLDKDLQAWLVNNGWFDWQVQLEDTLRSQ